MEENSHWVSLKNKMIDLNNPDDYNYKFISANLDYLKSNRIELGAITAAIGAQRFWEWLKEKILEVFPYRDINRAFKVPKVVKPQAYLDFEIAFENKVKSILKPSRDDWKDKLGGYEGFVDDTDEKLAEIEHDLKNHLGRDNTMKQLMKDLNILTN